MGRNQGSGGEKRGSPPSRGYTSKAEAPSHRQSQSPPKTIIIAQPAQKQPGLFGQMASTAAGVAVGSAVGHAVGQALTSTPQESYNQYRNEKHLTGPCALEIEQFLECARGSSDLNQCKQLNEALLQCKQRNNLE